MSLIFSRRRFAGSSCAHGQRDEIDDALSHASGVGRRCRDRRRIMREWWNRRPYPRTRTEEQRPTTVSRRSWRLGSRRPIRSPPN